MALIQVDLLKVDVERAELSVLRGIDAGDWVKIKQLAMEVHDIEGRLKQVVELLEGLGFTVLVRQEPMLEGTDLFSVQARRL